MNVETSKTLSSKSGPAQAGSSRKKFKTAFCEEFNCSPEEYSKKVFWMTLYSHARVPAAFLRIFRPAVFHIDSEFIYDIGETQHFEMFRNEIDTYHGNNLRSRSWLRNKLMIRLSGTKVKRLGIKLFEKIK